MKRNEGVREREREKNEDRRKRLPHTTPVELQLQGGKGGKGRAGRRNTHRAKS